MNNFDTAINGAKPVVVDFFAEWCGPCKMMPPILKDLKNRVGDKATILKMDIDKNPDYARKYGVQAVPTLIIFKNGKIVWRNPGVTTAQEIIKHLEM
ncbi:MAG TPA: thioredoxin [Ferruginibacter sp.]|nr:thioredoxin [Ferruginibacter sp.]